jgi:hypothetical protein
MKRANNLLHTPVRLNEMSWEDYLEDDATSGSKNQRVHIKAWRKLKHQLS